MYKTIKDKIAVAMKDKDKLRLSVLRSIQAECTNALISQKKKPDENLEDKDFISVVQRLTKQREESAKVYENAGRTELAEIEKNESMILKEFLPEQLSNEELEKIVDKHLENADLNDKSIIGKVMKQIMDEVAGSVDGSTVSKMVREKLSK